MMNDTSGNDLNRPFGTVRDFLPWVPNLKRLGYSRSSLREKPRETLLPTRSVFKVKLLTSTLRSFELSDWDGLWTPLWYTR